MDVISVISTIGGLLVGGGGVLFYKQNKAAKVIENESKLVTEWKNLYLEEKGKREENSKKIEDLSMKVAKLTAKVEMLEADKTNLQHLICTNFQCEKRIKNQ